MRFQERSGLLSPVISFLIAVSLASAAAGTALVQGAAIQGSFSSSDQVPLLQAGSASVASMRPASDMQVDYTLGATGPRTYHHLGEVGLRVRHAGGSDWTLTFTANRPQQPTLLRGSGAESGANHH